MTVISRIGVALSLVVLAGCAHRIMINPDIDSLSGSQATPLLDIRVGYHISEESKGLTVTTPGGGGDKVTYNPYRDLESAIYRMLSSIFADVAPLSRADDKETLQQRSISLIVAPDIVTTSSSSNPLAWPPTDFSVGLTFEFTDRGGARVARLQSMGTGRASYQEFKSDFGLSARRASLDALQKMRTAIAESQELRDFAAMQRLSDETATTD